MPRARRTAVVEDGALPGMDGLEHDPTPAAAVERRRPGRPKGSTTRGRITARSSSGRVVSKATQINQVRAEITTYLTIAQATWELRDPWCAQHATEDRIATIADRIASMIGRNDALLAVVTKTGIFTDITALLAAMWPIGRAVWMAHGPGAPGHDHSDQGADDDAERYPAYTR